MTGLELIDFLTQRRQASEASPEYQARRTTYQQGRNAELDRIAEYDADYRERLRDDAASWKPGPWDEDPRCMEEQRVDAEARFELGFSRQVLINAMENYLFGCVERSCVTGDDILAQVTSTDELIAMLQTEEDLMIATFGPPWEE